MTPATSDARGDHEAVDVRGTERLLEAAERAGVSNGCYVSIVGIDGIPYSYYESTLAAERAVEASAVPETVVRITQFHEFLDRLLGQVARLPVWPLPRTWRSQPIAVVAAAAAIVDRATVDPAGRVPDVGGPEVRTVGDLAVSYREPRNLGRPILRLPLPGATARAFPSGAATCPDRAVGETTWGASLTAEDG